MGFFNRKKKEEQNIDNVKKEVVGNVNKKNNNEPVKVSGAPQPHQNTNQVPPQSLVQPMPPTPPSSLQGGSHNQSENISNESGDIGVKENLDLFNLDDLGIDINEKIKEENKRKEDKDINKKEVNIKDSNFSLEKYKKKKFTSEKPIFISTEQFKKIVDNIEGIKNKIKISTDTYLRILDIKAEEKIEIDNLKKDFSAIEEKLYEIEDLVFER